MSADGYYPIPSGKRPEKCRSCGAAIVWTKTPAGKAIPLDLGHARGTGAAREALTHFATCPHGRQWRHNGGKVPVILTLGEDLDEAARLSQRLDELRQRARGAGEL